MFNFFTNSKAGDYTPLLPNTNDASKSYSTDSSVSPVGRGAEEAIPDRVGVYKYHPSNEVPKLVLQSCKGGVNAAVRAVVRRESVLIVTDQQGDWWDVTCSGYQGWVRVPNAIEKGVFKTIDQLPRYEDWRGNNYFFFGGRVMLGSDAKLFGISNLLILAPSIPFFWITVPRFENPYATGVRVLLRFLSSLYIDSND
jgi:hypothetical protein